jgi:hypothetical protein
MIVKNGAATIERALGSVRPHVDEVCVYLGGESTDGTPTVLERLASESGAPIRIEQGDWHGFADAREKAAAMASSDVDWLLVMDDDDVLIGGENLGPLLTRVPASATVIDLAYLVDDVDGQAVVFQERLMRPGTGAWVEPMHEEYVADDEVAFVAVSPSAMHVEHRPVEAEGRHGLALTMEATRQAGVAPRLHFIAGRSLIAIGEIDEGVAAIQVFLEATEGAPSNLRLGALDELAQAVAPKRPALALVLRAERVEEERQWRTDATAGKLSGIAALGPDFWPELLGRFDSPQRADDTCVCGSNLRAGECCGEYPYLIRSPLLRDAVAA